MQNFQISVKIIVEKFQKGLILVKKTFFAAVLAGFLFTTVFQPLCATASGTAVLKTNKTVYTEGESILVTASSLNELGKDWVGIWPKGGTGVSIYWEYISKVGQNKEFDIRKASNKGASMSMYFGIPAGEYTIYIIPNDMEGSVGIPKALKSVDVTVKGNPDKLAKAPISATYKLDNSGDGMADGILNIQLPENHNADDIYMWWGNGEGKLPGYTHLARFKVSGENITRRMTENTLIPEGATKLLIYTYNDGNGMSEDCFEVQLPKGAASKKFGKPLSEFQIVSDIHIKGDAAHEHSKHFVAMLEDVVKNSPDSCGIFTVGDNVDRGDKPEYWNYFHQLYDSVAGSPPLYLGIGNHESNGETTREDGIENFLKHVVLPDGSTPEKVYYDCWVNDYHYVFIGSEVAGEVGYLGKEQLLWLENTLSEKRNGRPIFLLLHQPMPNTVSGSSPSEGWSGISNYVELKAILDKFPEVVMFNGHTHWLLDSDNCMYDGKGKTASIFNTASVGYLWHSYDVPGGERQTGSEGYYVRIYDDKITVLGRNFVTGEWVSSAQFVMNYTVNNSGNEGDSTSSEMLPPNPGQGSGNTNSGNDLNKPTGTENTADKTEINNNNSATVSEKDNVPLTGDENKIIPVALTALISSAAVLFIVRKKLILN